MNTTDPRAGLGPPHPEDPGAVMAVYRELSPGYAERGWRAALRHLTSRNVEGVSQPNRSEPDEFAMIPVGTVADYRAVRKALRDPRYAWRITRSVPASGYPRRIYLAPDWEARA